EFRGELGFDVELEAGGVHRRVDDPRSDHAVAAQAGDEGLRLPAAERRVRAVALALGRPAGALGQSRIRRRLINEDQARQVWVEEGLAPDDPQRALLVYVGALQFTGLKGFFYD